jgi:hypothetical protein
VASMTVCPQEEDDIQEPLSMRDLIFYISNSIGIIRIVTVLRLTDRLGGNSARTAGRDERQVLDHEANQVLASIFLPRRQS